jgi:acetolactate synthase-1/2/3 large subunit
MFIKGAQLFHDALLKQGVEAIFGFPGGSVIPIFDVLYDSPIKLYLMRHEQGAGHAADGYARATGKVGVCLATSGPGATNLVTALATANFDSVPVVAFTGQVKSHLIGNEAFQEADVTGITRPVCKHNYLVRRVEDMARAVREAFHVASTGRPGVVVVDIPVDLTTAEVDEGADDGESMNLPGYKPRTKGHPRQIMLAAEEINRAERPVLYVGGGVILSGASEELRTLAHKANVPVTTTLLGLGAFPEDDPLALLMLGMHGTGYANHAVQNCDCLIAVGARFDDRVTGDVKRFAPKARIIHIDVDPASISKNIKVDVPVVGDARDILTRLIEHVEFRPREPWLKQIAEWKEKYKLDYGPICEDGEVKTQYVIEQICQATEGKAIITTDVGQHQMWAAQWYTFRYPRQFISSGGLGTMGFGLPAALGAQVGCPDRVVFDIAGDGSIQMNSQELASAVVHNLPVKVAIMNNGYLGMVRQWQEIFYHKRYSHTRLTGNPDFVKLAEAYGAVGIRVEKTRDVRPAIERAIATPRCVVLDFMVEREANVYPMVPAGEAIDRMIGGMA